MRILHRKSFRAWGAFLLAAALLALLVSCAFSGSEGVYAEAFGLHFLKEEEVPAKVTFAAAGDNLIHSSIYKGACTGNGYDFSSIYEEISDFISSFDIAFVNQETPLGADGFSGYPRFCSPFEVADALSGAGFDIVNLANNHMLDKGAEGLFRTKEYLENTVEMTIGADADGYRILERQGIKIAFLAYTYSTNCDDNVDVPRISEERIRRQVTEAREAADLVFVSMHWGIEYDIGGYVERFHPTANQEHLAELLTELGVDVLIGTHPHVLEGIQDLKRDILQQEKTSLNVEEILNALTVSASTNPSAELAVEKLKELRGCKAHCTAILNDKDEQLLGDLGIDITCDPEYSTNNLYFK